MSATRSVADRVFDHLWDWKDCTRCDLHKHRRNPMVGDGLREPEERRMLFVSDRFDPQELENAEVGTGPFYGLLGSIMEDLGFDLQHAWYTNAVLCPTMTPDPEDWRPIELVPLPKRPHLKACKERLHGEIRLVQPELLVVMGAASLDAVSIGNTPNFQSSLGEVIEVEVRGTLTDYTVPAIVTYSLSDLFRGQGKPWKLLREHIRLGLDLATQLKEMRNG